MKFEKINENQIRCTLNKADLADRNLLIHELAYGTPKAKALFREMMQQASYEVGFEAENIPLMIEAIPVSPDCLMLIITKVEDPEELDTRFSKFTKPNSFDLSEEEDDPFSDEDEEDDDVSAVYDEDPLPFGNEPTISDTLDLFLPLANALKQAKTANTETKREVSNSCRIFCFQDMKTLLLLAPKLHSVYRENNDLFRDKENHRYYLLLSQGSKDSKSYQQACSLLSEYGREIPYTDGVSSYYREHYDLILEKKAIRVLAGL